MAISYTSLTDAELLAAHEALEREFDHALDGANTSARGLRMIGMELRSEEMCEEESRRRMARDDIARILRNDDTLHYTKLSQVRAILLESNGLDNIRAIVDEHQHGADVYSALASIRLIAHA